MCYETRSGAVKEGSSAVPCVPMLCLGGDRTQEKERKKRKMVHSGSVNRCLAGGANLRRWRGLEGTCCLK